MQGSLIIIDDFYQNADELRKSVLELEFSVRGNYPGQRTVSYSHMAGLRNSIQKIIAPFGGRITSWPTSYNGAFQYTTKDDKSWIHSDQTNEWAGVCYLTPDAPANSGTGIFRHKKTGMIKCPRYKNGKINMNKMKKVIYPDTKDYSKWDMTAMVGNVYNRLVLYRGDLFHRSLDYFGKDKNDGRLFQTFFFDTEI